jgi:hypothetical protein
MGPNDNIVTSFGLLKNLIRIGSGNIAIIMLFILLMDKYCETYPSEAINKTIVKNKAVHFCNGGSLDMAPHVSSILILLQAKHYSPMYALEKELRMQRKSSYTARATQLS